MVAFTQQCRSELKEEGCKERKEGMRVNSRERKERGDGERMEVDCFGSQPGNSPSRLRETDSGDLPQRGQHICIQEMELPEQRKKSKKHSGRFGQLILFLRLRRSTGGDFKEQQN